MVVKENRYGVIVENETKIEKIAKKKNLPAHRKLPIHLYF